MKHDSAQTRLRLLPVPRSPVTLPVTDRWRGPTFGQFLADVEHEFGSSVDTHSLFLTGIDHAERLTPAEVKELCGRLGVPAEDFGV